jgi:hypothetical protein
MIHFAVFFVAVTIIVIFLATQQRKPRDRFCLAAVSLLALLAVTSVVLLRGTNLFPAAAFALAALLLAHRSIAQCPSAEEAQTGGGGRSDEEEADDGHKGLDGLRSAASACAGECGREASSHALWIAAAVVAGVVSACGW